MEEGLFGSFPPYLSLAGKFISLLTSELGSSGFQNIWRINRDTQVCGTKQILNSWTFHSQLAIAGLLKLQPARQSVKFLFHRYRDSSVISVTLETLF